MSVHTTPLDDSAVDDLAERFRGRLLRPDDEGYDEARTVWNAMVDRRPALIAQCAGAADVIAAVDVAREHDALVAVRGGGHNVTGNAVADGGLVIDCSRMTSVGVDPDARTARVEPGVTLADLDHETQAFGLAASAGVVSTTGVAGLTLGGGWGWLSRRFGLAADNLRAADVVTAEGELVHAGEDDHDALLWGLRGGGGNFGVVTAMEFDLHEVGPEVLGGMIVHPYEAAGDLLRFHREVAADAPRELCCYLGILTAPEAPFLPADVHGETVVALVPCYSGDLEAGEEAMRPLREFGDPIADVVQPMPFTAQQQLFDEEFAPGARNYWKTQLVDPLPEEAIDVLVERAATLPTPETQIILEHLGGAIADVPPDATAYRHRDAAFSLNLFARWTDPDRDDEMVDWAREFHAAIAPLVADRVAVNFLSREGGERVRAAYGDNYDRLVDLKNRYDPGNLFRLNQNVEPTA